MGDIIVIGIAGGTGSGKTTITEQVVERLGDQVTVITHDNYYRAHHEMSYEERVLLNYDHPDIFDHDLLYEDLRALTEGREILEKGYDFSLHRRNDPLTPVVPGDVLILEGIHTFYDPRVRDMLDFKLFMKVDPDICLLRRVQRDINERGRAIDGIARQYLSTVKPMYEKYVRGYEQYADIIVARGGRGQKIADVLACYINDGRV